MATVSSDTPPAAMGVMVIAMAACCALALAALLWRLACGRPKHTKAIGKPPRPPAVPWADSPRADAVPLVRVGDGFADPLPNWPDVPAAAQVLQYSRCKIAHEETIPFENGQSTATRNVGGAAWKCHKTQRSMPNNGTEFVYSFQVTEGVMAAGGVAATFTFDDWGTDNYIVMPAAAYDGNRFDVLPYPYPPLFKPKDYNPLIPITITDVPRLAKGADEPSRMDLNTGDLSVPGIGIYFPRARKGIWLLTEQATARGNSGLTLEEAPDRSRARFRIAVPCVRERIYSLTHMSVSGETGADFRAGDEVVIRYTLYSFDDIKSPKDLNNKFLSIRKTYGTSMYIDQLPFSEAFRLMEKQQNDEWWSEEFSFYTLGSAGGTINNIWQLGWVGGLMITLPLAEVGSDVSQERSFRNYDRVIRESQSPSGFLYGAGDGKKWYCDCFGTAHPDNLHLLRKNADAIHFIYKYCFSQRLRHPGWEMPGTWRAPMRRLGDAFDRMWREKKQWGQFIDIETGEILVGGTNSVAVAIAGLALGSVYEDEPKWMETAKEAAQSYYINYTMKGISCGGPGEILQNCDTESAFALLEAFVVLFEVTGERMWLDYANDAACYCATWMVSYDYAFPADSLFGKLDMKTSGVVWANIQNKHGGPGACTASGDCLFKLYRATGNKHYLGMIRDLAHNIMQYISRPDRHIKDQHDGWINERVNLSDWEGKEGIGNIFCGNTWAQVSAMLTVAQVPGIYVNLRQQELVVFDHVEATISDQYLTITNKTKFEANVRVFIDKDPLKIYPIGFIAQCPLVKVKSGETKIIKLDEI